jgi:outer membrane protein assembly factor BamB
MFVGQTDGEIYVLDDTTGKALFRFQTSARNFEPFHVVNGVLLVQAEDMLYAFQLPKQLLQPL